MLRTNRRGLRAAGLALVLSLGLAACGGADDPQAGDDGGETTTDGTTTDGDTTDGDATTDGGEEATKVGLVFDIGGRGDQSFNDAAARGLDQAAEEFTIETKDLEPSGGGEDREQLLRLLAQDDYPLIFGIGFAFQEAIDKTAQEFPDTTFAIVDSVVEQPNVASLVFAEHEGSFLVGAAAALTTETDKLGFVGGVEVPLIEKFAAGFVAGAKHINPDIEVEIKYLTQPPDFSGFGDPQKGKEAALAMYNGGADVVYHAAGGSGSGVFQAAAETSTDAQKNWAIGVDSDQYNTAEDAVKEHILTSMLKQVDVAVFQTIESFVNGEDVSGVRVFDLESDGVGYSTSGGFIDDLTDQLDEIKQKIIDGEIEVPETMDEVDS